MKKISTFNEFVSEGLLANTKKFLKTSKEKVENFINRMITSGDKAGTPAAVCFDSSKGSIEDQLLKHFKGTPYAEGEANEAKVPLEWPKSGDVLNMKESELKSELKSRLKRVLREGEKGNKEGVLDVKPIFIFGSPGIGKTQIVAQVCDELGKELYNDPLTLHFIDGEFAEPVDFAGVPSVIDIEAPSEEFPYGKGITRSNVSVNLLPNTNGKNGLGGIIFIDELNRMPSEVIKIFMKLVQSRRLGESYQIPLKWYIVAAGNRPEDDPREIKNLGNALRDRFTIVNFVPDVQSWKKHILGSRLKDVVVPELIDFLEFQGDYFHDLDPAKQLAKYPTPRAWVDSSVSLKRALDELEDKGIKEISEDRLLKIFQMEVGFNAASAFVDFYKIAKSIPVKDLELPFTDPEKAPLPSDLKGKDKNRPDYEHALFSAITRKSMEKKLGAKEICNFVKYLKRLKSPEWGNSLLSNLIKYNPYIRKDRESMICISEIGDIWGKDLDTDFQ